MLKEKADWGGSERKAKTFLSDVLSFLMLLSGKNEGVNIEFIIIRGRNRIYDSWSKSYFKYIT